LGLPATRIRALAAEMTATRTMVTLSWSLQRAHHGEQPYWAAVGLASVLGQIGLPGGGIGFGYAAINGIGHRLTGFKGPTLPQGKNAVADFIPVARIADMLLKPGGAYDYNGARRRYPDIKLVYWAGGNVFHHHQDINRLIAAWRRPETTIVHEQFWTAHTRHCDIVLPATVPLERDDIGGASDDSFLIAMKRAMRPIGEARDDYAIFADLAARLGVADAYTEGRDAAQWLRHLYDQAREANPDLPDFEQFWAQDFVELPAPKSKRVFLGDFRADPFAAKLATPSGKIELYSATVSGFGYDDCPGHPVWREPDEWLGNATDYPLHLLSNQPVTRLHSQYDPGGVSVASKIAGREPIAISPKDAAARGLANGDVVRVHNLRGAFLAGVRIDDGVREGVVVVATGAWFDPVERGRIGSLDAHGNPNMVTADRPTSKLGQGCAAQTVLVEVEKFEGAVPPVRAFDPPDFAGRD
jgi:biotin/methionine sulfoxide reductase